MRRIKIGIPVHAEPARLLATLAGLRAHTPFAYELLLLPDGPDVPTQTMLVTLRDIPQSATATPCGVAACFNRLVRAGDADVFILLESGAIVGPGWLDHLFAALAADPCNGLAGPTTNIAWNKQGVYPRSGSTPTDIVHTAHDARACFGGTVRTLEPLYSLVDFCYVVRREVIEVVGAADERYGLGPCWEMDYSIRAARAGFRGVWACAAYVHRSPFTARRRREEDRRFELSKRLYQHKFCAGHLRGDKADYRTHCRGDECSNFAPAASIEIRRPFLETAVTALTLDPSGNGNQSSSTPQLLSIPPPLVSCIMPTCNRRKFIPHALDYFFRQDYPNVELIIVDDGTDPIGDCLPADERVRYIKLEKRLSVGAKRNLACQQARGAFIVHWDDDDWYPSWRVTAQVRALHEQRADVCGTSEVYYYEPGNDRTWQYVHRRGGGHIWVAGNTLAYRKAFWERNKFLDIQVGEDLRFLWSGVAKVIHDCRDPRLCVGMIHDGNVSRKVTTGAYWQSCAGRDIHQLMSEDLLRYQSSSVSGRREEPLVSCIMPTYNRRPYVKLALGHFFSQDYPNKELIIVDDGTDSVEDLVVGLSGVRYIRLQRRTAIGTKRNLACQAAKGDIIAHWDDDDWYAPDRLRYQLAPLLANEAEMTGLTNTFVLQLPAAVFWTTGTGLHRKMFVGDVHGGTLVYKRTVLDKGVRYPDVSLAEDAALIQQMLRHKNRLVKLANPGIFVYVRHEQNAWKFEPGRFLDPQGWTHSTPPTSFPPDMIHHYKTAAEMMARKGCEAPA
jgi:glycosyltransferase involved in cell wall biosynthesis